MIPSKKAWISSMTYPFEFPQCFCFTCYQHSRNFGDVKAAAVERESDRGGKMFSPRRDLNLPAYLSFQH
jgi:hypothetical protein